jgi:PadR family transcriptional regulator, regulatory protein PadR
MKEREREILLAFWKVHMLHYAGEEPLHGQWMLTELQRHGYESPRTLYPLLQRMEPLGWLKSKSSPRRGRARKDYRLTAKGQRVLGLIRKQITELYDEIVRGVETKGKQ